MNSILIPKESIPSGFLPSTPLAANAVITEINFDEDGCELRPLTEASITETMRFDACALRNYYAQEDVSVREGSPVHVVYGDDGSVLKVVVGAMDKGQGSDDLEGEMDFEPKDEFVRPDGNASGTGTKSTKEEENSLTQSRGRKRTGNQQNGSGPSSRAFGTAQNGASSRESSVNSGKSSNNNTDMEIPPGRLKHDQNAQINCNGTVFSVSNTSTFGFIYSKVNKKEKAERIFFYFKAVVNLNSFPVSLCKGTQVEFAFDSNQKVRKGENGSTPLVVIRKGDGQRLSQKAMEANAERMPVGTVCKGHGKDFVLIKADGRDFYMNVNKVSKYSLPLQNGDKVGYVANYGKKTKTFVRKAKVQEYSFRQPALLEEYLGELRKNLKSKVGAVVATEVVSLGSMWQYLANKGPQGVQRYVRNLMGLANMVLKECKTQIRSATNLFDCLLESDMMNKSDWESSMVDVNTVKVLADLMMTALKIVPQRAAQCHSLLERFIKAIKRQSKIQPNEEGEMNMVDVDDLMDLIETLLQLLKVAVIEISKQEGDNDICGDWQALPSIITQQELLGETMVSKDQYLTPVLLKRGYDSTDEYMSTYLRLFRAETFEAIQKGVHDLKKGQLDKRDMAVYRNIGVVGLEMSHRSMSLALSFLPPRKIKDWSISKLLMTGNLLCISPSGQFEDVIWAVVSNRDEDMLNKGIMFVELCEFNKRHVKDMLSSLQSGSATMVESPGFFKPMGAVLNGFQAMDLDKFSLCRPIVHVNTVREGPDYLYNNCADLREIMEEENCSIPSDLAEIAKEEKEFLVVEDINANTSINPNSSLNPATTNQLYQSICKTLNPAQKEAFTHALTHRLALIQGPPGTGKTFLGIQLVQVMLSCLEAKDPILVVTFKNHALDEFIKGIVESGACSYSDVVRIGGKSKDKDAAGPLDACNLRALTRTEHTSSLNMNRINELKDEIKDKSEKIGGMVTSMLEKAHLTQERLLEEMTEEQLLSLFMWDKTGCQRKDTYKINKKSKVSHTWINGTLLPELYSTFTTLCNFVSFGFSAFGNRTQELLWQQGRTMLLQALALWLPPRDNLLKLRQLSVQYVEEAARAAEEESSRWENQTGGEDHEEEEDLNQADQEHIKEVLEGRALAFGSASKQKSSFASPFVRYVLPVEKVRGDDADFSLTDFPSKLHASPSVLNVQNVWTLDEMDKFKLIYAILTKTREEESSEMEEAVDKLVKCFKEKKTLDLEREIRVLQRKKIIAMTISGASIHNELMQKVKPSVVVVEEAAEIIETSLVAALNEKVKHLILIGDHQQLRPQVDSFKLAKDFHLDVSMMERLISAGYPCKTLTEQNRMRPEFAELLLDIYPGLMSNMARVGGNEKLPFMVQAMSFWSHSHPEAGEGQNGESRSKKNVAEAYMVVALAQFFLAMNVEPEKITILSSYLGQVLEIRKKLTTLQNSNPSLFKGQKIQVCTIDQFQGDENDYIILSLVRSNSNGIIGFLNTLNRRCVAQSRAKCGMYFVGSETTLTATNKGKPSQWKYLIDGMYNKGCVSTTLPVQCPEHKALALTDIKTGMKLSILAADISRLCKHPCGKMFDGCTEKAHACKIKCQPPHSHEKCLKKMNVPHPKCNHPISKQCFEEESKMSCQVPMPFMFPSCGHPGKRKCHAEVDKLPLPPCHHQCPKEMPCKEHACNEECGAGHMHDFCQESVGFIFPGCSHIAFKECSAKVEDQTCKTDVQRKLSKCGHIMSTVCSAPDSSVQCRHPCVFVLKCGHKCKKECGEDHNHEGCGVMVNYCFPDCGHPGTSNKPCTKPISWCCKSKIHIKGPCGHQVSKICSADMNTAECFSLCQKMRKCGHPCTNNCSDDCEKGECNGCRAAEMNRMKAYRHAAEQKARALEVEVQANPRDQCSIFELRKGDPEYMEVEDLLLKFIKPHHKWYPHVTKIEKVDNVRLRISFERAKKYRFHDHVALKFHGSDDAGIKGITTGGFREPTPKRLLPRGQKPGMYGQGIYFATDSSKSAQAIYTKGSNKLLLCEVQLGRAKKQVRSNNNLTFTSLRNNGFDSVFAPRGSDVQNDEFVVFDKNQAYPKFIIHYGTSAVAPPVAANIPAGQPFIKKTVKFDRNFNQSDFYQNWFIVASGAFTNKTRTGMKVDSIDVIHNQSLVDKFEAKKKHFAANGIPAKEILAFHGTDPSRIPNILKTNLDPNTAKVNGRAYGNGTYFSEMPDKSLGYTNGNQRTGLMLFRVLPGNENPSKGKVHCKDVSPDKNGCCQELIITDAAQFVPVAVYSLK